MKNVPHFGTAFIIKSSIAKSVKGSYSPSETLSLLTIICGNKNYNLINVHARINDDKKTIPDKVKEYWELLGNEIHKIPRKQVRVGS